jgi:hypothetical protein
MQYATYHSHVDIVTKHFKETKMTCKATIGLGIAICFLQAASARAANIALNPTRVGFPTPLESDPGWGCCTGNVAKWEIVDGRRSYDSWQHGLPVTGGAGNWGGEPAGMRQVTIDFGMPKTFNEVVVWHHGHVHAPAAPNLDVWNGSQWSPISFARVYGRFHEEGSGSGSADSDEYSFAPVSASKVRYSFDNSALNVEGTPNEHGWIYEIEVALAGDFDMDGDVDAADYLVWKGAFGSSGPRGTGADGNRNEVIDAADYIVWRNNLSAGIGGDMPAAVPEPATAFILVLAAASGYRCRRTQV